MEQTVIRIQYSMFLFCPVVLVHVMFSTSSATVRCISCRRCGGMRLSLDTWGPPGIWCRSDRSLESPQTAPHHSPHSVLTPLGLPGCAQYKYYLSLCIIIITYFTETLKLCQSWGHVTPYQQVSIISLQHGSTTGPQCFQHKGKRSQNRIVLESHMTDYMITKSSCNAITKTTFYYD